MKTIVLPEIPGGDATVAAWLKQPGDQVAAGNAVVRLDTTNGPALLESSAVGTLSRQLTPAGTTIPVGTPVAELNDEPGTSATSSGPSREPGASATGPTSASERSPMTTSPVTPILMPKAGQSMEEGTIVEWKVQPGDQVKKGQVIFEVETDKATMDVEATDAGRLARIVLPAGGTIEVLQPVAYLAESDDAVSAFLAASGPETSDQRPEIAPSGHGDAETRGRGDAVKQTTTDAEKRGRGDAKPGTLNAEAGTRVKASPAARKAAEARGVEVTAAAPGSGPGGRVLSTDVTALTPAAPPVPAAAPAAPVAPTTGGARQKLSKMRRAIATNLQLSKQTVPHFYMKLTCNAEPLQQFYQTEKAKYPCSLNDVIVKACGRLLAEMPAFRSRIEGDEIVTLPDTNIGLAVGVEDGLVVPVVTGVDRMPLQQLAAETKRIVTAARGGKISGIGQGVFTISNLGMFGIEEFSAIINPPEAAILAVGAVREEVIVSGGTLRAGRVMTCTLSVDHRVVDGVQAAKFMNRLKEVLEYPAQLLD